MTSVWVADHGWCYLNAAIDCCTREIVGWALDFRCRAQAATAVIDAALAERGIGSSALTLGTDNGSAFTSRVFRAYLADPFVIHRRGGYRDRESHAFSEPFAKLEQRCVWREGFETSTRPAPQSAPSSIATTTGPTRTSPIARHAKSPSWKNLEDQSLPAT